MSISTLQHDTRAGTVDNPARASGRGERAVRKYTERVQFLSDVETKKALSEAVRELEDRQVSPPADPNSPNRITLGFLMRELTERHLRETIEALVKEHGPEPKPKKKRR
jgi:hypothetical protein